jgi:DNA topoisomerase-1
MEAGPPGIRGCMRLVTADPARPGLTRRRSGRGFRYFGPDGRPVRDPEVLERVRALVIPPAWRQVWICPRPNGHLQAVGTDAAGRRQYLYHEEFRRRQELAKHEHVLEVGARLPAVRKQVAEDLGGRGLSRERVLACAVRLLDVGFFRIGSESYTLDNGSYGLTTMLREHVRVRGTAVTFDFPGKSGKHVLRSVLDPAACRAVTQLKRRRAGGDRLLAYWDPSGRAWRDVHGDDLNRCLRDMTGTDVTAKDFRTWHGTVLAAVALAVSERAARGQEAVRRRAVSRAVREVAGYLGNTPAVCRASYINPRVIELFEQGVTIGRRLDELGEGAAFGIPATQGPIEEAVLRLLDRRK